MMQKINGINTAGVNNNQIKFTANLSKIQRQVVNKEVQQFMSENRTHKPASRLIITAAYAGNVVTGAVLPFISKEYDALSGLSLTCAAFSRDLCLGFHNAALEQATKLAGKMKEAGFNLEEREHAVKRLVRKEGSPIHYAILKVFKKKYFNQLAEGEASKGSFPTIISKNWLKKGTEEAFGRDHM